MISANSVGTNLAVTAAVILMVVALPWLDRRICGRLGLNLQGGVSKNPNAEKLLRLRQGLLLFIFGVYVLAIAWLVFFSRSAAREYQVHIALFEDLHNAVNIDLGFLDFFRMIFTDGFPAALSHIQIIKPEDITQVYMNVMLFVPMGYLLPYLFDWFRKKARWRPVAMCFVLSLLIENLQLISRRGFYDIDDLVSNVIGGFIGQWLFISAAYVVTHPNWRKELKSYRRWKRNARGRTLYPFARKMGLSRTTLTARREEDIWDFYVMRLGFRMIKQIVPEDQTGTDFLLEMGKSQVEIHCLNRETELPPQTLTMSARHLTPVLRRLEMNGIKTNGVEQDVYTGLRCVRFSGPDGVCITVIEE